jgi:hypothetical protein
LFSSFIINRKARLSRAFIRHLVFCVDPHVEKYYSISPYAYCEGNPVNATDPNGKDKKPATDKTTAIDNTSTKVPEKIKQIQIKPQTDLQKAMKVNFGKPSGKVVQDATPYEKAYYATTTPIDRQLSQNVVVRAVATGGLAVMASIAVPVVGVEVKSAITTGNFAVDALNASFRASVIIGGGEGIIKAFNNAPQDTPYLTNNPVYQQSSDFFNGLTTIVLDNIPQNSNRTNEKP